MPVKVIKKDNNFNLLKTTIFSFGFNKNYILVNTLSTMDNWEITVDTQKFMGYKCQKAT